MELYFVVVLHMPLCLWEEDMTTHVSLYQRVPMYLHVDDQCTALILFLGLNEHFSLLIFSFIWIDFDFFSSFNLFNLTVHCNLDVLFDCRYQREIHITVQLLEKWLYIGQIASFWERWIHFSCAMTYLRNAFYRWNSRSIHICLYINSKHDVHIIYF